MILLVNLLQRGAEIAHQRAADAAGIDLGNLDAGLFHEAAVDANLAKLVFHQHQLLAGIGFTDQLLDEGRLTGTQKAGKNINFCHGKGTSI